MATSPETRPTPAAPREPAPPPAPPGPIAGTARGARSAVPAGALAAAALALAVAGVPGAARAPRPLPAIVFVSREPPADPRAVPGLGPGDRALVTGGRLMVREPDGALRSLLPEGALADVADPSVSPDARRVAFAGIAHRDSGWRLWVVNLDGTGLAALTRTPRDAAGAAAPIDDLDPAWISEHALVFASTRHAQRDPYGGGPVTNLFRIDLDAGAIARLTAERNGAEEPWFDAARGRVLFARWWFNRWRADAAGASRDGAALTGVPGVRAVAPGDAEAEAVNLWQVMEISPDGGPERLAAGAPAARAAGGGTQPVALANGRIAATVAPGGGLFPHAGPTGVGVFDRPLEPARRLAGAASDPDRGYGGAGGLAPPRAASPAPLPDGALLIAYDPGGRGDFGVWLADPIDGPIERLVDLEGTLELDPAPVVAWLPRPRSAEPPPRLPDHAPRDAAELAALPVFRYANEDVFSGRDGPARTADARLRVFAALARPGADGGDSVALIREAPIGSLGRIDLELPAGVPLFEQLVDGNGRPLSGPLGPAHVAGFNAGPPGGVAACTGCHLGHSLRAPRPAIGR
jgi:hypothetical protein